MTGYSHPEVLVDTQWVSQHKGDHNARVIEVDYDPTLAYHQGHIPGSILVEWKKDMNDPITRDIITSGAFQKLLGNSGVSNNTTVILYGDFNNWFAAFAFWIFKYYGHSDVRLMNGGRKKWIDEKRELTKDVPTYTAITYTPKPPNEAIRAYLSKLRESLQKPNIRLVDVRSPKEFNGEMTAPPEYPTEHAQRGGHIPGAVNIPWGQAVREDGTFKSSDELQQLYKNAGVTPDKEIITYCRIGERSSHSWFVLKYLLGYPNVINYDGSWTEWGNMVKMPIEKPAK